MKTIKEFYSRLTPLCSKCEKPKYSSIFEPCSNCGYQHPLTEHGKEMQKEYFLKKKRVVNHEA